MKKYIQYVEVYCILYIILPVKTPLLLQQHGPLGRTSKGEMTGGGEDARESELMKMRQRRTEDKRHKDSDLRRVFQKYVYSLTDL